MAESLAEEPTLVGRLGSTIPMLLPGWLLTSPLRWLLARQGLVPPLLALPLWVLPMFAFAFAATRPDRDALAAVVFAVVVAGVFHVAQVQVGPPVPAVQGKPVYLLGPLLNAVGAALVGVVVAYRGGTEGVRRWLAPDDRRAGDGRAAGGPQDDS